MFSNISELSFGYRFISSWYSFPVLSLLLILLVSCNVSYYWCMTEFSFSFSNYLIFYYSYIIWDLKRISSPASLNLSVFYLISFRFSAFRMSNFSSFFMIYAFSFPSSSNELSRRVISSRCFFSISSILASSYSCFFFISSHPLQVFVNPAVFYFWTFFSIGFTPKLFLGDVTFGAFLMLSLWVPVFYFIVDCWVSASGLFMAPTLDEDIIDCVSWSSVGI